MFKNGLIRHKTGQTYDAGQTFGAVLWQNFKKIDFGQKILNIFSPDTPLKLKREVPYTYFCTKTFLPDPNIFFNCRGRGRRKKRFLKSFFLT